MKTFEFGGSPASWDLGNCLGIFTTMLSIWAEEWFPESPLGPREERGTQPTERVKEDGSPSSGAARRSLVSGPLSALPLAGVLVETGRADPCLSESVRYPRWT